MLPENQDGAVVLALHLDLDNSCSNPCSALLGFFPFPLLKLYVSDCTIGIFLARNDI